MKIVLQLTVEIKRLVDCENHWNCGFFCRIFQSPFFRTKDCGFQLVEVLMMLTSECEQVHRVCSATDFHKNVQIRVVRCYAYHSRSEEIDFARGFHRVPNHTFDVIADGRVPNEVLKFFRLIAKVCHDLFTLRQEIICFCCWKCHRFHFYSCEWSIQRKKVLMMQWRWTILIPQNSKQNWDPFQSVNVFSLKFPWTLLR